MRRLFLLMLLSTPLAVPSAGAETAEERGHAIAVEMDQRDAGWGDQSADMRMILRNRQGDESIREIRTRTLEVENDGDKSLTLFDAPLDVKGTAFLSHTHATAPDDQWLYLPALKRVKRIASQNKSGPFMGSEFAYEDLSSQEVAKYTYKYLRDEEIDGRNCFVIERYPEYEYSGYTRQVVWIDQAIWRPVKLEFYDRKDSLLKTLVMRGYNVYQDRFWRPDEMHMENHQNGKNTTLIWKNYRFGNGLSDRDFDHASLQRAR